MEVLFGEVLEVVNELPIGYYAKRRIDLRLDKEEPTSYYNPLEDKIVISYPIIARGLENADGEAESYKETAIRSMVYHELSHAILTPPYLLELQRRVPPEVINIFEDERIETILKDFYMDVNFKQNLLHICGNTIPTATNPIGVFFNLVRFRYYSDKKLVKEVERIINYYKDVSTATGQRDNNWKVHDYVWDIVKLYEKLLEQQMKQPNLTNPNSEETEEIVSDIQGSDKSENGYDKNNNATEKSANKGQDSKTENGENSEIEKGEISEAENGKNSETEKEEDSNAKQEKQVTIYTGEGGANNTLFEKILKQCYNNDFIEQLNQIISNFNKKTGSGNGCTGYSGIFNPRNIKNNNYKFFDRKINSNGNNKFGKIHLNLFIDESGSFCALQDSANKLINSLARVEHTNPNFDFDLICDSEGFREMPKNKRKVTAEGGNSLDYAEVVEVMKKHTKKDCYNYNIVLHDGKVYSVSQKNAFLGWNRNNVSMIDTGDNRHHLEECKQAKVYIHPYEKLVNGLEAEVLNILKKAFK